MAPQYGGGGYGGGQTGGGYAAPPAHAPAYGANLGGYDTSQVGIILDFLEIRQRCVNAFSFPGVVFFFRSQDSSDENKAKSGKKSFAIHALNKNVYIWMGFFSASLVVYSFLSGGDFSFLMTYGAMSRMFGFGILNVKTFKSQRATGVSIKSLQLYFLVFFFRLTSIVRHEGYLPYDRSGDWLYHLIEITALLFVSAALYACMVPFKGTYQGDQDCFGEFNVPPGFGAVYIAVPVFVVAIFIHPNLNADFLSDAAWTYAMYLESCALIPQLYMFQKQASGVVELLTAHFVAALGFGRLMEFFFWIYSYHELASKSGSRLPGYLALLSQFVQLVLMVDFFWYYFMAVKNATPLVLPQHNNLSIV